MAYDPFARGTAPVGVRSLELRDESRGGRTLPLELWYPADAKHRGQDLDDATRDRFTIAAGISEAAQRAVRGADPARGAFPADRLLPRRHRLRSFSRPCSAGQVLSA